MTDRKRATSNSVFVSGSNWANSTTSSVIVSGGTTAGGASTTFSGGAGAASESDVLSAVYSHIQAMRALGKTQANTLEIAQALGLTAQVVERAAKELANRGVKFGG